jgi:hypothetical protein
MTKSSKDVLDSVRVIIYRCHEKGLEVFLMNNNMDKDPDIWNLPKGDENPAQTLKSNGHRFIELDPIVDEKGATVRTFAIEADWHEIPSIRGMLKHDVKLVKYAIDKGTYFCVKEAFKRVLPNEYKAVKELKDLILDRNLLFNI